MTIKAVFKIYRMSKNALQPFPEIGMLETMIRDTTFDSHYDTHADALKAVEESIARNPKGEFVIIPTILKK